MTRCRLADDDDGGHLREARNASRRSSSESILSAELGVQFLESCRLPRGVLMIFARADPTSSSAASPRGERSGVKAVRSQLSGKGRSPKSLNPRLRSVLRFGAPLSEKKKKINHHKTKNPTYTSRPSFFRGTACSSPSGTFSARRSEKENPRPTSFRLPRCVSHEDGDPAVPLGRVSERRSPLAFRRIERTAAFCAGRPAALAVPVIAPSYSAVTRLALQRHQHLRPGIRRDSGQRFLLRASSR